LFLEGSGKSGGEQYLSSFWYAYNILARENPDVLTQLANDWYWEKPTRSLGVKDIFCRPILGQVEGKPQINFGRTFVAGHPKYPMSDAAPPLTSSQKEALRILTDTVRKNCFQLDSQVGDMLLINNLSIMHARNAFMDDMEHNNVRHLLRLWLRDGETSWPIAPSLKYKDKGCWNVAPELQTLRTLTEWVTMPRAIRVVETTTTADHD
jgi:hypothetical protein